MEHYVVFVQQRIRFLNVLRAKRFLRTSVIRQRFLRQRAAANTIQKQFLEWNYTPGRPGYRRLAQRFEQNLRSEVDVTDNLDIFFVGK